MLIMGRQCWCGGQGGIWEISAPPSIYFCKPKTTLKNKIFPEKEVELCVQIWGNLYDVLINEENHRMNSRV